MAQKPWCVNVLATTNPGRLKTDATLQGTCTRTRRHTRGSPAAQAETRIVLSDYAGRCLSCSARPRVAVGKAAVPVVLIFAWMCDLEIFGANLYHTKESGTKSRVIKGKYIPNSQKIVSR